LGMYQIRTGYSQEWPAYMDYGRLPDWVNTLWIVWCFVRSFSSHSLLLPIVIFTGLDNDIHWGPVFPPQTIYTGGQHPRAY
jgi:hypothetical protein